MGPSLGLYIGCFALLRRHLSLNELRLSSIVLPRAGQTLQDPPAHDVGYMFTSVGLYVAYFSLLRQQLSLNDLDYPSFFYPKLAKLSKTLLSMMESIYYIHNFKGRNGGTLFRSRNTKNYRLHSFIYILVLYSFPHIAGG